MIINVTYLDGVYEVMVRVARMTAHGVAFVPSDRVKDLESLGLIAELNNDCEA